MSTDNLNYYSDPRVIARDKKLWYVKTNEDQSLVVIRVQTSDWHWLSDNDYSPEEFEDGLEKPTQSGECRNDGKACWKCDGSGELLQHPEYKGITGTLENLKRNYPNREVNDINYQKIKCFECNATGKDSVYHEFDEPRLDPEAEDRPYKPFRHVALPCKMVDCSTCRGTGRHVNPSIDAGGISEDDFRDDPDFRDEYFSGTFDVTCYECKGSKTTPMVDIKALCTEDAIVYDTWMTWQDDIAWCEYDHEAERRAERRMGC